ncbi:MAG TPA: hypothetical protein PKL26_03885 [Methanolinea sp.]|nr:hypothetical protein [Methanolinea sp.]
MNGRTTSYSDREIIGRWAILKRNPAIDHILAGRGLAPTGGEGVIGYFYVDHEEGISVRIHALCRIEPGKLPHIAANFEDHGEDCVLRYDEFGEFRLLSTEEANNLLLSDDQRWYIFEDQRWFIYYDPEKLHEIRNRVDLDRFRAPGYFDDVSVILIARDQERIPEVVWVRLEELSADGKSFQGILLNEPDMDFGVHEGDMLTVRFAEHEEGRFLVAQTGPA